MRGKEGVKVREKVCERESKRERVNYMYYKREREGEQVREKVKRERE